MKDIATNDYSRLSKNLPEEVIQELKASAIAPDIIALNFYSFDGNDENELDEVFTELIHDPKHNNNGTLSGTVQNNLVNHLRSGGWYFKGYKGFCAKPNNPRKDKDGKVIKYESPQGAGNLQLFIPRVTWRITLEMEVCIRAKRTLPEDFSLDDEDTNFWEWFLTTDGYLVTTEGAKTVCGIVSNGVPAIGLNGIYGWGTNIKDESRENVKDEKGFPIKEFHPNLSLFLNGREIILAFDRDEKPETAKKVDKAKTSFAWELLKKSEVKKVTELNWDGSIGKGIDDLLSTLEDVHKREAMMSQLIVHRTEVVKKATKEPSEKSKKSDKTKQPINLRFTSSVEGGLAEIETIVGSDGVEEISTRIGNHLQCIAYVNTPEGNGSGLQLEFQGIRGNIVNWTMSRGYLVFDTPLMLSELIKHGYQFNLSLKKQLIEYLNSLGADVEKTYTVTDSTGWVKGRYISQHKTYGEGDYVFHHIEPTDETATETKGTLSDWKTNVGAKCDNNSRLIFGLGVAFAAPLLDVVGLESGGFHLVGTTSTGKTTTVKVAVSVTGEKVLPNWRTTANGLEMTATAHNHSLLALDEIGQADEKGVGESCYMLRNGQGKSRSTKDLKARKVKTWRLLFFSTGEDPLAFYMAQAGKAQKGGQEVGMPDIPAVPFGSPYGAFESIHGYETSKEFAETLEADCKKYRGTAIDAFLTQLVIDRQDKNFDGAMAERVFKAAKRLAEGTTDLAVSRVANRFALVQVALELAHSYDILPFDFDRIEWAVKKMFDDWLSQRGGDGSIEVKKACDRIRHLITSNFHSDRMYDLKDRNVTQKVRNLLGYVNSDSEDAITEIWIPIPVFNSDVCQGVNKAQLIAELQKRGWLASPLGDERPTHQRRFKGKLSRFFVFLPPSFQDDEKTMGTVGTVGTASKNSSDKDSGDTITVPIVKNGMGTVGTALPENAGSSDNTPINEPEPEIDPDILTEF